jgi:O-antigen/teichoic acid export membrane protein
MPCLESTRYAPTRVAELPLAPESSLTRRAFLTAVASLLDYGAKIGVSLFLTPLLVDGLGRSLFGVWEVLVRLVGYLSIADGRPTDALRLVIANKHASQNVPMMRRAVGSALMTWFLLCPVIAAAGAVLVWSSPALTKVALEHAGVVRLACALAVVNFLLGNAIALPESVLLGMNLGHKRMGLRASLNVVSGLLVGAALYFGLGLVGIAGAQVAASAVAAVVMWFVAKRYVAWFRVAIPSWPEMRSFFGLSVWKFAGDLVAKLLLASDVVILGLLSTTAMVTTYVLTGYACSALVGVFTLGLGAMAPGMGGVIGEGKYAKAAALREEITALNWICVGVCGSAVLLWNRSFLQLWVGSQNYAGVYVNALIVVMMAQTVFIRTDSYVIDATLRLSARVLISTVAAVLTIVLAVLAIPRLGMAGLCLSILAGRAVQTFAYPYLVKEYLGRPGGLNPAAFVRPALVIGVLFAASAYVGDQILVAKWFILVPCAATGLALTLCIVMLAGLSADARRAVLRRMRMTLSRAAI